MKGKKKSVVFYCAKIFNGVISKPNLKVTALIRSEMSRSYYKTPISGITKAESEKQDKTAANRKERRLIHKMLICSPTDVVLPQKREISYGLYVLETARNIEHY